MGYGVQSEEASGLNHLIAIDPGTTTGWAVFVEGRLKDAAHLSKKMLLEGRKRMPEPFQETVIVIEKPLYYPNGKNKGDPNTLITLGILAGEIAGLYRRKVQVVEYVTPLEWKGTVPKDVCHSRVQKLLEPQETMPANHNARDAVGIGLWKLGRYRR